MNWCRVRPPSTVGLQDFYTAHNLPTSLPTLSECKLSTLLQAFELGHWILNFRKHWKGVQNRRIRMFLLFGIQRLIGIYIQRIKNQDLWEFVQLCIDNVVPWQRKGPLHRPPLKAVFNHKPIAKKIRCRM